jgi:hypothetical protein
MALKEVATRGHPRLDASKLAPSLAVSPGDVGWRFGLATDIHVTFGSFGQFIACSEPRRRLTKGVRHRIARVRSIHFIAVPRSWERHDWEQT